MPYMTVAENVWVRREPMRGLGFMDFVNHAEMGFVDQKTLTGECEKLKGILRIKTPGL